MLIYNILAFVIFCFILVKSSGYAAKHSILIAKHFRISGFVVSLLIMGILSTLPETSVSIISSIKGSSEIGFGTLIGSNIADLTIILGIVALTAKKLKIKSKLVIHESWFIMLTLLPFIFVFDGVLDRGDGILLIISSFVFFHHIFKERRLANKIIENHNHNSEIGYSIVITLLNIILLIASAYFVVYFTKMLSLDLYVPPIIIASIFIALGTCLPELLFSIQSIKLNQDELALGDIIGNVIIDATLALGITAVISPIFVSGYISALYSLFTFGSVAMLIAFLKIRQSINITDSLVMIFYYIIFVFADIIIKSVL